MSEERRFGMHPNLLFDIILRQAGTLQKAILEGVMNAIDAGATQCDVTLDTTHFSVEDNGKGFASRQEIKDFFDTFGTPHEEGDAIYGRFRMGRGQMMAFGRNTWRSRQFQMDVDIKAKGLDYTLTELDDILEGTRIEAELYEAILPSDLERTKNELRKFVAWAQIPVTLNGEVISQSPSEETSWTHEDDNAYYLLSSGRGQMAVYNLGVLVNQFPASRFGMGGTIVTKKQVEVNFARNDVQSTCPIFRKIQNQIKANSSQTAKKKTKLTDSERELLTQEFLSGELSLEDAAGLKALTCVHGRHWPMSKLNQIVQKFSGKLVLTQRGDQLCETAQKRGLAFCLDDSTLERFGVSNLEKLLERVVKAAQKTLDAHKGTYTRGFGPLHDLVYGIKNITVIERDDLTAFVNANHIALSSRELTPDQRLLVSTLQSGNETLVQVLNRIGFEDQTFSRRILKLGRSETAYAWTDGTQNIWFNDAHARLLRSGYAGAYQVAQTMLHEMLHTGPDTGTHEHDFDFYQAFHDIAGHPSDPLGKTAKRMVTQFTALLRRNNKKISSKLLEHEDVNAYIDKMRDNLMEREEADA
jgi:hypothetical protein